MVECGCFPADEVHAEPGPFYTHLKAARDLVEMRKSIETGVGCPLAKWVRCMQSSQESKI